MTKPKRIPWREMKELGYRVEKVSRINIREPQWWSYKHIKPGQIEPVAHGCKVRSEAHAACYAHYEANK